MYACISLPGERGLQTLESCQETVLCLGVCTSSKVLPSDLSTDVSTGPFLGHPPSHHEGTVLPIVGRFSTAERTSSSISSDYALLLNAISRHKGWDSDIEPTIL